MPDGPGEESHEPAARRSPVRVLTHSSFLVLGVWAALAVGLAEITGRVTDWFTMTDELLYERYAISYAGGSFPLPHLRGQVSHAFDQLYPLLISPFFSRGLVPRDLHDVHVANAWIMSSACIPAFLLARRVTGRLWPAYLICVLSICLPWAVYAPFLSTEIAAYPAFLWAILAAAAAIDTPSRRNDVLALLGLGLAFFARTEFIVLVLVLPVALVAFELGRLPRGPLRAHGVAAARAVFDRHRVLAYVYAFLAAAAGVLALTGRLHSILGVYGDTINGSLVPPGTGRDYTQNLATLALALGILPLIAGGGWLLANLIRPAADPRLHAFACLGAVTVAVIPLEAAIFDARLGAGDIVFDRYFFYLAPLVLLAFVCALRDRRRPRFSMLVPGALVLVGFATDPLPTSHPLDTDMVIAVFDDYLRRSAHSLSGAQTTLVLSTLLLVGFFLLADRLLRPGLLTGVMVVLLAVTLPAGAEYTFARIFSENGWSGRPLTLQQGGVFDWIDRTVGTSPVVTMVPFAQNPDDYYASADYWEDLEFWNKSVQRAAYMAPGVYDTATGTTFPKIYVQFDPRTGFADRSPTRYAAESDRETRFRLHGTAVTDTRGVELIPAGSRWRADWLSFGLYDDGWTEPGKTATIRVFPLQGQHGPVRRRLAIGIATGPSVTRRPFVITSNMGRWTGVATNVPGAPGIGGTTFSFVDVCVPARGFADARLRVAGSSAIPGDLANAATFTTPRQGGAFVAQIALADEIGPRCKPG